MTNENLQTKIDLVYWTASARKYGLRDQVKAAVAGGFTSMAITAETFKKAVIDGIKPNDIAKIASDAGVPIHHFDTITDWSPIRYPSYLSNSLKERFDFSTEEILKMCEVLDIKTMLAFPCFELDSVSDDELFKGFANLCDKVKSMGIRVDLEFVPFLGVPNLSSAWKIINTTNRSNSGLVIDIWHFAKGGSDMDLLRSIPAKFLRNVQISDGYNKQIGPDLIQDCLNHRSFAGEGELPVNEILEILQNKGELEMAGPETFSKLADGMTPSEVGKKDGDTIRNVLSLAGIKY
ncbi:MAG: sugar phosphate isomerase/epimerase family protein [Mesonia hippocampi]|uniref:sugar phosphate isomerase/epimerase family protein n=1 Tax=Mesonia hippocampi TaxID=1628250 RepID=UPI003F96A227